MESDALNKDQEIAGSAAALFSDSSSPFDAFFDTKNSTFQTTTQDDQPAASFFDNLASEQSSQTQQETSVYSSYYGYDNSSTLQEGNYGTVTNETSAQQYNLAAGYDYNNHYGEQYGSTNTNGITEDINSLDPQSTATQYQYGYTGYSYDGTSYSGQDHSQYYDYSQQQQYYDPNGYSYYYNPSAYHQYTQEISNSNENNFHTYIQDSINVEQQQNLLQELPDHANSQINNSVGEVDKNTLESKQNFDGPDAGLTNVRPELSTADADKIENNNRELFQDNDKEIKDVSQAMEYSTAEKSIEKQDIVPTLEFQEHPVVSSLNDLTSSNIEDVAAVTLVETIETNQESANFTVSSAGVENDFPIEQDSELNEDQEVNIIHGDDHDIFEYQPQESESHPKTEHSHVEQPSSSLTDEPKITPEISAASGTEGINDKSEDEPTKLDDLDDLVLGSTSKSSTSQVLVYTELEGTTDTQGQYSISARESDANSSSYQYDYSSGVYQYGYEQWGSNDINYQYQEYDTNQTTGDTTTSTNYGNGDVSQTTKDITTETDHANYQYDTGQTAVDEKEQSDVDQYSSQPMVENSSAVYQDNYQALQSTTITETDQSKYQYQGYEMGEQEQYNYQYQIYETGQATTNNKDVAGQYTGYDTNQVNYQAGTDQANYQAGTDQANYQYQEYETRQDDTKAGTDQSNYQYYQGYRHVVTSQPPQNSPPPMSPSPKSLIPCPDPQCGGENKITAKFCSDCGKSISKVANSITSPRSIPEINVSPNLYNNNLNGQSLPYNHSQASYSTSSFSSYSNQLDQQQYYGADDMSAVNDVLGRSKGCRPIVAFGFGGKIYTMFPRTVQRFTSTDQNTPITKSAPGAFSVRVLKDIIPVSDVDDFPGPLLMDNNRGGVKAKKKSVSKFLDCQIQAAESNFSSFNEESEKKKLEDILIVWNLFKIMFENEGMLIGSSKVEELVRKILVPSAYKNDDDEANFTVPADTSFESQKCLSQIPETSLNYSVSTMAVDKVQELLLKGDRVAAIHHAMNENLWAHALIIASCVNKDLWKEVVTGFVKHEMGNTSESNGRESLRVLYSLFAGQGQNAVREFLPHSNLLNRVAQSSVTAIFPVSNYGTIPHGTPKITALHDPDHNVPIDNLVKWRETIAMILANRASGDTQAISALGDVLKEYGLIHAAHACYMLSPNVSLISGFDAPNVRFTILGNDYTHNPSTNNFYDWKSLRMTEIYEFGLSLNSNDGGLPHLQAYKLLYAWWLADFGYLNEARRYCESIANIVKVYTKGSPYFHGCFLQKLKDLTQRLLEHGGNNNGANESSSWLFAKKMPKATLDSLWGSLEGKFNKFVAGDSVDENVKKTLPPSTHETIGPFSHFSSITHPTSEVPSRSVSASDFRSVTNPTVNMRRATTPNAFVQKQLNGNQRRSSTPGVGLVNGSNNTYSPTTSDGQNTMASVPEGEYLEASPTEGRNGYENLGGQDQRSYEHSSYNNYSYNQQTVTDNGYSNSYSYDVSSNDAEANNKQNQQTVNPYYQPSVTTYKNDSAWWNNPDANFNDTTEDQKTDQTQTDYSGEGEFISPMDNFAPFVPSPTPIATSTIDSSSRNDNLDESFDDLGLGNHAFGSKKKSDQTADSATSTNNETKSDTSQIEQRQDEKQEEKQEEQKAEEKKGWFGFGRLFGKKEGGKSANLGEESTFYFDPVQNRWINKKAGSETNNTLTPPPPPPQRSKTTSPQPSRSMMSSNPNRQSLPPIDNNNLTGMPSTPPPPNKGGRASSASMKRGVRSRYVDIMSQPPN